MSEMTNSEIKCEQLRKLFEDHYWDTFESDKKIILKHIDFVLSLWNTRTPEPIDSIEKLTKLVSSIALECKKLGLTQVETSNILKHTFSTTEPTKPSYSACPDCKFTGGHALVCKSEPTKAENGLVRLDDIKLWETINTTCSLRGITLSRGNISIIRDAILYTFGTPSITKDQLLATIDKAEKEYFSEGAYYRTDIPQGICNHIKQRIEELYL